MAATKRVYVQTTRGLPVGFSVPMRGTIDGQPKTFSPNYNTNYMQFNDADPSRYRIEISGRGRSWDEPYEWTSYGACPYGRFVPVVNAIEGTAAELPTILTMPQVVKELTHPGIEPAETEFLGLVNAERAKLGVAPLTHVERAAAVADAQATNVDINLDAKHDGSNCDTPSARAADLGLAGGGVSEVVTYSYADTTPAQALTSWMNSPPHRASLMDGRNTQIGIAVVHGQWAAVLGTGLSPIGDLPYLPRVSPADPRIRNRYNQNQDGNSSENELSIKKPGKVKLGTRMTVRGFAPSRATVTVSYGSGKTAKSVSATADSDGEFSARVRVDKPVRLVATTAGLKASRSITPVSWVSKMKSRKKGRVLRLSGSLKPARAKQRLKLTVLPRKGKKRVYKFRSRKGGKVSFRRRIPSSKLNRATLTVPGVKGLSKANSVRLKLR